MLKSRGLLDVGQDGPGPTIGELIEPFLDFSESEHKPSWHSSIQYHIRSCFTHIKWIHVTEIEIDDIEDWHKWIRRRRKVTVATANRVLEVLGSMMRFVSNRRRRFGISKNWVPPRMPYKKESRSEIRVLTADEIGVLAASEGLEMRTGKHGKRVIVSAEQMALFVHIGILAGLRKQEILHLRPVDVGWERSVIVVQPYEEDDGSGSDTKTSRVRRVPIHSRLTPWLKKIVGGCYFPGKEAGCRADFRRPWNRLAEQAQIDPSPRSTTCATPSAQSTPPLWKPCPDGMGRSLSDEHNAWIYQPRPRRRLSKQPCEVCSRCRSKAEDGCVGALRSPPSPRRRHQRNLNRAPK